MSLIDSIINAESSGNPSATNPLSSASGLGQFIDSTWLNTIRQHRPDLASRYNTQELLSLKADPALSRDMTAAYAADNAAFLRGKGLDTSPGSVYLAHFAGPQGAASLLSADPSSPVSGVLSPDAIRANPFLRNMTVGQVRQWAAGKMGIGGQAPTPLSQPQAMQPGISPQTSAAQQASPVPSTSDGQNSTAALGAVPALMSQFEQRDAQPPQPMKINFPTPPGLLRARLLAQAMAAQPLAGDQQ